MGSEGAEMEQKKFVYCMAVFQGILCLFFGLFSQYEDTAQPTTQDTYNLNGVGFFYPFYQDIHVMMFIGFGFLMTFMRRNAFSSVGFNFLITAQTIQWALLVEGFFSQAISGHYKWSKFPLDVENLIKADFASAAVLISYGGVLGKVSPFQLCFMAFSEVCFYALNEALCIYKLQTVDMGGSMYIHVFGAYFGLAFSWIISHKDARQEAQNSSYNNDVFAMIGTLFLWMFWPSFNGALALNVQQHRVVVNTVLSLCGSCVAAFVISARFRHHFKFDMVDIQNATLAGGVAVGACSDLLIQPWGAVLIGMTAGTVSCLGFIFLQPFLEKHLNLHDSCGIHNLHGIPGIIGGIGGVITSSLASETAYNYNIGKVFPARAPSNETLAAELGVEPGTDRSASGQAWYQLAGLLLSFGIAATGGIMTGLVVKYSGLFHQMSPTEEYYEDTTWWNNVNEAPPATIGGESHEMKTHD